MGQRALGREAAQPPGYPPRRAFLLNDASMHTPDNTPSLEAVVDRWFRDSRAGAPSRPYLGPVLLSASARRIWLHRTPLHPAHCSGPPLRQTAVARYPRAGRAGGCGTIAPRDGAGNPGAQNLMTLR